MAVKLPVPAKEANSEIEVVLLLIVLPKDGPFSTSFTSPVTVFVTLKTPNSSATYIFSTKKRG